MTGSAAPAPANVAAPPPAAPKTADDYGKVQDQESGANGSVSPHAPATHLAGSRKHCAEEPIPDPPQAAPNARARQEAVAPPDHQGGQTSTAPAPSLDQAMHRAAAGGNVTAPNRMRAAHQNPADFFNNPANHGRMILELHKRQSELEDRIKNLEHSYIQLRGMVNTRLDAHQGLIQAQQAVIGVHYGLLNAQQSRLDVHQGLIQAQQGNLHAQQALLLAMEHPFQQRLAANPRQHQLPLPMPPAAPVQHFVHPPNRHRQQLYQQYQQQQGQYPAPRPAFHHQQALQAGAAAQHQPGSGFGGENGVEEQHPAQPRPEDFH